MEIVEDQPTQPESQELDRALAVEFVPCLASIASYKAEDGTNVRYMANFVYHDGSAMTQFLDDPELRSSLKTILMVGYEWKENDGEHLKKYFEANNLPLLTVCVQPNPGFDSLEQEMDFFKNLNENDKDKHLSEQTLGPGKMAKFILDTAKQIKKERLEKLEAEAAQFAKSKELQEREVAVQEKHAGPPAINPNLARYACRMCRTILFGQEHLAPGHVQNLHSFRKATNNARQSAVACQSVFCGEPVLKWLSPSGQDTEGKLTCPKCSFKIGHWRWAGAQCSCGTWITPAIQIPVSKVDTVSPISTSNGGDELLHSASGLNN